MWFLLVSVFLKKVHLLKSILFSKLEREVQSEDVISTNIRVPARFTLIRMK